MCELPDVTCETTGSCVRRPAWNETPEIYLTVAATIGVNWSTANSIVPRYLREGKIAERPRGGANHARVDDEMSNCLNDFLNEDCLLTLAQISQELATYLSICPLSHPCLSVTSCSPNIFNSHSSTNILWFTQHGAWTRWHNRLFFAGQQGGFVHQGVALPILFDITYLQMFLLLFGRVLPVFLGRGCLNPWFICASVSRQSSFKMSFRQLLISSPTRTWFAPPRGLSAIFPSRKYRGTMLLAVDQFTPIVAAIVK